MNIGSPQGCVLSPLMFILYTNSCTSSHPGRHIVKFADDTALISLLRGDEVEHGPALEEFISWCDKSHLILNPSKTKEMSIDFRRETSTHCSTIIKGEPIESVTEHKYLGVVLDHKLKWDQHTEQMAKKGQQRLYFLKKLVTFGVDKKMLKMFYSAFVESVLTFCIVCWFGSATEAQKHSLRKIITTASKIQGVCLNSLQDIYNSRLVDKAKILLSYPKHPLFNAFELLPSGRRYRHPALTKNRTKQSFVPQVTGLLNKLFKQ